jgi:hypothetical protein
MAILPYSEIEDDRNDHPLFLVELSHALVEQEKQKPS